MLVILGLLLVALDSAQRWYYVSAAPALVPAYRRGEASANPLTRAILVAGAGMDEAESATSRRDVQAASKALQQRGSALEVVCISPGMPTFCNTGVLGEIQRSDCHHLIVFLTGHGGGKNFGAVGGLNLTRDAVAEAVAQARFERATLVLDFCWSGEFARSFEPLAVRDRIDLITSTDAHHPCPYPVSFLSPRSFGRMLFDDWSQDVQSSLVHHLAPVNQRRRYLRYLYPPEFGLEGELRTFAR